MSVTDMNGEPPWEEGQGWRVLTPDGQIVASGPLIELEMATELGEKIAEAFGLGGSE